MNSLNLTEANKGNEGHADPSSFSSFASVQTPDLRGTGKSKRRGRSRCAALSLGSLHYLISERDWQWLRSSPATRHPIIRNPHGILFQVTMAAPGGKTLLIDRYEPPQTFKDDLL